MIEARKRESSHISRAKARIHMLPKNPQEPEDWIGHFRNSYLNEKPEEDEYGRQIIESVQLYADMVRLLARIDARIHEMQDSELREKLVAVGMTITGATNFWRAKTGVHDLAFHKGRRAKILNYDATLEVVLLRGLAHIWWCYGRRVTRIFGSGKLKLTRFGRFVEEATEGLGISLQALDREMRADCVLVDLLQCSRKGWFPKQSGEENGGK